MQTARSSELDASKVSMPALFIGHGSPTNAIEDNEFSQAWAAAGASLPKPRAILCISAHWETRGTKITAMAKPKTIYDFYGFPQPLYEVQYPSPGSPELAQQIQAQLHNESIVPDYDWGLDHGAWSVLCRMFPKADIPVLQLSLDSAKTPAAHYALGKKLKWLRNQGVLILGSGNIVHNLGKLKWEESAYDWAVEFDNRIKSAILAQDHGTVINYQKLGGAAQLSVPSNEHYLPLLYILALHQQGDVVSFFAEKVTLGAISMRCVRVG